MDATRYGHFDAGLYQAAQETPTLQLGPYLYRGRLLSIEEWLVYAEEIERLRDHDGRAAARAAENAERAGRGEAALPEIAATPPRIYVALYRRYLYAVFPRTRLRFWIPDPVHALFRLPWGTVVEAISGFFVLQALASAPRTSPSTNGADSPPSTASAPAAPAPAP